MKKWTLLLFLLLLMSPLTTNAEANNNDLSSRKEVLSFLKGAFEAQVSLSEKERGMDEIHGILSPYFTKNYETIFLKENLVHENGKYMTYGSDFARYFIPFFQFSDETKIVILPDEIFVYEYFEGNKEGPVEYESHYEGIRLTKDKGKWKVDEYLDKDIPNRIIELEQNVEVEKNKVKTTEVTQNPSLFNPLSALLQFGAIFNDYSPKKFYMAFHHPDFREQVAFR
ncbi:MULTISPECIES: DUF3993 domain-containing protein [unclassified Bacillus (in: firmicutes)]|uniref:DUF3993 domain-containing protein n=1 Tax=unclassified Bacillus (in: firmicutes) TaxID=185979 RepID=UPI0008EFB531|nr:MULTISPECIES: DUF3993 domain-containing protein [unclassified Bacillus (in: firmicutes)]SFA76711.1 Protein of unknown function [Bacillus sp. UNCCL13]SFQ66583.1 Protein of unknown function [Bacillus sp. cl95]